MSRTAEEMCIARGSASNRGGAICPSSSRTQARRILPKPKPRTSRGGWLRYIRSRAALVHKSGADRLMLPDQSDHLLAVTFQSVATRVAISRCTGGNARNRRQRGSQGMGQATAASVQARTALDGETAVYGEGNSKTAPLPRPLAGAARRPAQAEGVSNCLECPSTRLDGSRRPSPVLTHRLK